MSVLIKGMEMPKNCDECNMLYVCKLWMRMTIRQRIECKHPFCPLIEIKTPHGRLIDADELWDKMSIYTDNEGAKMPFGYDDTLIHRDSACFMIENATTIIEAEGREK